ncbi:MAG TPA: amidase family protein [Vicinamibacterales bacterium]|nr:amidase family protein [Vicinamibacterales bacterium]
MRSLACAAVLLAAAALSAQVPRPFQIEETTIAQIQAAFRDRSLTCRSLVEQYLARIEANDKRGAALNAIVQINADALKAADDLDRRLRESGPVGPMHCVPVLVKDNYETVEMPTTAGSLSLKGMMTGKDAFVVKRLRDAGAVMIARSNMAEFAFSPVETVNSILPGYTRNPYDTTRVTAGSSGGSGAGIAANFALIGLASDTGDSIRGPAAHQALVGLRSTMGLVSRAGVVPLNLAADIAGAVTRTVADTAAVLQVIAGPDPADPITALGRDHVSPNYAASLRPDGLKGARLGVLHQAYDTPTLDSDIDAVFKGALGELRNLGAEVLDPVEVAGFDTLRRSQGACNQFKYDLNRYLAGLGDKAPMHSLDEIVKSRRFHPSIQARLESGLASDDTPGVSPGCRSRDEFREKLRVAVVSLMDSLQLDALVYPTWSNPPRLIGDLNTPGGDNNQLFSPSTGFPAITVPMGYTRGNSLPAGLQFFGRAWSESRLLELAFAYEQATHHRRPPVLR